MEKEFYTEQEKHLIEGAIQIEQALNTKRALLKALALDLMLLEMEEKQGLMDGLQLEGAQL